MDREQQLLETVPPPHLPEICFCQKREPLPSTLCLTFHQQEESLKCQHTWTDFVPLQDLLFWSLSVFLREPSQLIVCSVAQQTFSQATVSSPFSTPKVIYYHLPFPSPHPLWEVSEPCWADGSSHLWLPFAHLFEYRLYH